MLHGVGIDIVDIERFERIVGTYGDSFVVRWFTAAELAACGPRDALGHALAQRFALKEAVWKSIGPPRGAGVPWKDIVVSRGDAGSWSVELTGSVARAATRRGVSRIDCDVSATSRVAMAVAQSHRAVQAAGDASSGTDETSRGASWR